MNKTILWHVGIIKQGEKCVVCASKEPLDGQYYYNSHMRIRSITGRAAARRFIRGNLLERLENSDDEPWNMKYTGNRTSKVKSEAKILCVTIMGALPECVTIVVKGI